MMTKRPALLNLALAASTLALALGGCSGGVPAKAEPTDPAGNFHVVSESLSRGGRPDEAGVTRLHEMGVRLIVDLEDDMDAVATERGWATALGIEHRSAPMNGETTPADDMVNDLLATFADPSQGPFFVHCQEGVDRTGVVVGLYRVFDEGWTAADAYTEMKALGFKTYLSKLRDYYSTKTGYAAQE